MTPEQVALVMHERELAAGIVAMWATMYFDFIDKHGFEPDMYRNAMKESAAIHRELDAQLIADTADRSIDQSQYTGDHCGYLAAQAQARINVGVTPTADQQEAWNVCNISDKTLNEVMP
jgi:hypothetical protein